MGDQLAGVSVVSPCDAWAVGTQQVGAATFQTLAEHWNGLTWTPAKSSNPGGSSNTSLFSAVAVKSPTDGWAVGDYHNGTTGQTLIERLTGGAWKPVPSPDPGGPILYNALGAVTIISAKNAWAVGDYFPTPTTFRALIVHWNGAKWSVVSSPNPSLNKSLLLGVTATSAKDVWAVGFFNSHNVQQTLIEHWNGTTWKRVPSPDPGGPANSASLMSVAASSPSNAWAVGWFDSHGTQKALILHWNGIAWKRFTSPSVDRPSVNGGVNTLSGVTILSAKDAWAVGTYSTLSTAQVTMAAHWNGKTWTLEASPNLGSFTNAFTAVAASSPADIWAVGDYQSGTGLVRTMAYHCC